MRFRFLGFGRELSAPISFHFQAATPREACEGALRVLQEVTECEWAEVTGRGCRMRLSAAPRDREKPQQPRLVAIA